MKAIANLRPLQCPFMSSLRVKPASLGYLTSFDIEREFWRLSRVRAAKFGPQ